MPLRFLGSHKGRSASSDTVFYAKEAQSAYVDLANYELAEFKRKLSRTKSIHFRLVLSCRMSYCNKPNQIAFSFPLLLLTFTTYIRKFVNRSSAP